MSDSLVTGLTRSPWCDRVICIFLVAISWIVFGQTVGFDFVNYDDSSYVQSNALIQSGFTKEGLIKAFTGVHSGNWHPVTTLSHMLDCQLFDLHPGGHHATNVFFHTIAVVLLFLFLRRATGWLWPSAFIAAIFAVHPLRAESVAWISERKDVLSAVFFIVTLLAYLHYIRQPSIRSYLLVMAVFTLGLMSKPMLVTTPFILLLLDYWPLQRFTDRASYSRLFFEKAPMVVLSMLAGGLTIWAQKQTIAALESLPLLLRINNAAVATIVYIKQLIWPSGLVVFYSHPRNGLPEWEVIAAVGFLLIVSIGVIVWHKSQPFLMTGWFWYLIMLSPVIGIVQVGAQSHADRYTYLPHLGLLLMVVGLVRTAANRPIVARIAPGVGLLVVFVLFSCAYWQTNYWRNSETLWRRAIAVTGDFHAYDGLGLFFLAQNRLPDAIEQFEIALKMKPDYPDTHFNLGLALQQMGKLDESISQFAQAIAARPNYPEAYCRLGNQLLAAGEPEEALKQYRNALICRSNYPEVHYNIGMVLTRQGDNNGALAEYKRALEENPNYPQGYYALGNLLLQNGSVDDAIRNYRQALQVKTNYPEVENNLGFALLTSGRVGEAIDEWRKAVRRNDGSAEIMNNLAWVLATYPNDSLRNGPEAVALAGRAIQLAGNSNPGVLRTLAAAYAEVGNFSEALRVVKQAIELAGEKENMELIEVLRSDETTYETAKAIRTASHP